MLYTPIAGGLNSWKANNQNLRKIDSEAKSQGTLLHRYIAEPHADGNAIYQIIRVNKKTVRIRVCTGLGDDWTIPYWGKETSIPLDYAKESINRRDALAEIFKQRSE